MYPLEFGFMAVSRVWAEGAAEKVTAACCALQYHVESWALQSTRLLELFVIE
jgi:hypothetical protein